MTDHLVRDLRNIIQADKTISQTLRAFAMVLNDFSNAREADGEDSDCELLDEEAERLRDLADKFSC